MLMVVYGILDEWLQKFIPGRSSDIQDFFMDLAGVVTGLIICSFLTFWPAGLLVAATFIFGITNLIRANLSELLPFTGAVFHLISYAIFTILWIHCMNLFLAVKAPKLEWFISAILGPTAFLIIVKLFSIVTGKDFTISDIIISFVAITAVVTIFYTRASFRKKRGFENR